MAASESEQLAAMVRANDKLLKALTVLLAIKDDHLMDELRMIFALAARDSREMREGSQSTWDHLHHELSLIARLVENADEAANDDHGDDRPN